MGNCSLDQVFIIPKVYFDLIRMKVLLIDTILASWLLMFVESLTYFPSQVIVKDELPYQPFMPDFRGHSSKDRFYQVVRSYPMVPEYSTYPENNKKGPCSGAKDAVKHSVKFCAKVKKRQEEAYQGCNKTETPIGNTCPGDDKCYTVTEYYDSTPNNMYAAYQRACPCPQKHLALGDDILNVPFNLVLFLIVCLGQSDSTSLNQAVLTVQPNSNICTSIGYDGSGVPTYFGSPGTSCIPTTSPSKKYLFVCEVPCITS